MTTRKSAQKKKEMRKKRHRRVRSVITGTKERPRLCVYRSNKYLYAQIIDDQKGKTIVSHNSKNDDRGKTVEDAKHLGQELAKKAKDAGITQVVFDRGGFLYTGRIKALAEAVREGGIKF